MHVLVVDDDPEIRDLLRLVLEGEGYTVDCAIDGREALRLVLQLHADVDLVLLDMRMPVMDGWTFAQEYRRAVPQPAPIIVITAAQDAAAWAQQVAARDYVAKPFDLAQLRAQVQRWLGLS